MERKPILPPEERTTRTGVPARKGKKALPEPYDRELIEEVEALRRDQVVFATHSVDDLMAWLRRPDE
jgi:hypothetical protein